jgi:hypothetical protein
LTASLKKRHTFAEKYQDVINPKSMMFSEQIREKCQMTQGKLAIEIGHERAFEFVAGRINCHNCGRGKSDCGKRAGYCCRKYNSKNNLVFNNLKNYIIVMNKSKYIKILCLLLLFSSATYGQALFDGFHLTNISEEPFEVGTIVSMPPKNGIKSSEFKREEILQSNPNISLDIDTASIPNKSSFVINRGFYVNIKLPILKTLNPNFTAKLSNKKVEFVSDSGGFRKSLKAGGYSIRNEILSSLNVKMLNDLYDQMGDNPKNAYLLITNAVYTKGHLIIKQDTSTVELSADSLLAIKFQKKPNSQETNLNANIPAAYNVRQIDEDYIYELLWRKGEKPKKHIKSSQYFPFGIHQFTDNKKNTGLGYVFAIAETALLGTGIGYCISAQNNLSKHKDFKYEDYERDSFYNKYINKRCTSVWLFAGAGAAIALNYFDNFNWFRKNNIKFTPAPTLGWHGKPQMSMTVNVKF